MTQTFYDQQLTDNNEFNYCAFKQRKKQNKDFL